MHPQEVKRLIETGLIDAEVLVDGDGSHFTAVVISTIFADKSRVQKQQLVYDTVRKHLLDGTLHALSIQTFTPEEWQQQNEAPTWKN
ncbi:MAG TPA: BolA/IbaG family iron-sulfur metabolism protein [Gammaproteobacteria bacterium]|jgi:acid stress-induced BolA-like protein IbaG/YrbA|nr:BolA/IbaG family iron-sulfur metabolism protein [Gammaproteobacteria bacterium]